MVGPRWQPACQRVDPSIIARVLDAPAELPSQAARQGRNVRVFLSRWSGTGRQGATPSASGRRNAGAHLRTSAAVPVSTDAWGNGSAATRVFIRWMSSGKDATRITRSNWAR